VGIQEVVIVLLAKEAGTIESLLALLPRWFSFLLFRHALKRVIKIWITRIILGYAEDEKKSGCGPGCASSTWKNAD
jgi:hypothetical protein